MLTLLFRDIYLHAVVCLGDSGVGKVECDRFAEICHRAFLHLCHRRVCFCASVIQHSAQLSFPRLVSDCLSASDSQESKSAVGIDFKIRTIDLDGRKIKLQIWYVVSTDYHHSFPSISCLLGILRVR
jgi:hypothetical protein